MKIKNTFLSFCLLSLLLVLPLSLMKAQSFKPGYVITNSNDTINGLIQYIDINQFNVCTFKKDQNSKSTQYLPGEIHAYRFNDNGKFFVSMEAPLSTGSKMLFLECLIKGKASIYYMNDKTQHFFMETDNVKLTEISEIPELTKNEYGVTHYKPTKITGKLKYMMSDCPSIFNQIDDLKLYPDQLLKLSKDYQQRVCKDEKCIIYEEKADPVKLNFGIVMGLSYNNFLFNETNYTEMKIGNFEGFKLEFENIVYSLKSFTLNTGLQYQYYSTYTFHTNIWQMYHLSPTGSHILNFDIMASSIKIPLSVNYMFSQKKISPYIGLGFTNTFYLNQNRNLYITDFNTYYGKAIPLYHPGLMATLGLKYKMKNRCSLFIELNGEFSGNINLNQAYRMQNQYLALQTGYML